MSMTPAEADQRIILSRQTYHRYRAMIDDGILPDRDMLLFDQEILQLNMMAEAFPEKAGKLASLADDWKALWRRLRDTMH